ncbi:MAG: chemotaxis-specific protein-glutamate methyltransferase CheB [Chloroflexota bacterium]|nr:chemotaxis-specific protein-glutamate methyltransferase CheB [Chloroflexota bacterium]
MAELNHKLPLQITIEQKMPDPIKVLIVEDSPTVAAILRHLIESDAAFQLVGVASNGAEAIRMTAHHHPQVITMDVNMPHMSGLEATEYIMAHNPTPILVITASLARQDIDLSFKMLSAGALEIIEKPTAEEWARDGGKLLERLKLLSRIKVITHLRGKSRSAIQPLPPTTPNPQVVPRRDMDNATAPLDPSKIYQPPTPKPFVRGTNPLNSAIADRTLLKAHFKILGIAASTGGPPALSRLLKELPADFPLPILLVQHIPSGFSIGLAEWLNGETPLRVKNASEGEIPLPGTIYLSTDDRHLAVYKDGRLHLDDSPARFSLRPSADITFESMSLAWPGETLAVILTGMGRDGSIGMESLKRAGGYNIAQDEATSVIFGMPKSAIERGVIDKVLALNDIAPFLKIITKSETH